MLCATVGRGEGVANNRTLRVYGSTGRQNVSKNRPGRVDSEIMSQPPAPNELESTSHAAVLRRL